MYQYKRKYQKIQAYFAEINSIIVFFTLVLFVISHNISQRKHLYELVKNNFSMSNPIILREELV